MNSPKKKPMKKPSFQVSRPVEADGEERDENYERIKKRMSQQRNAEMREAFFRDAIAQVSQQSSRKKGSKNSAKKRASKAQKKWAEWQSRADEVWNQRGKEDYSRSRVAVLIAKEGEDPAYIAQRIKNPFK